MQKIEQTEQYDENGVTSGATRVTRTDTIDADRAPASSVASRIVWFIAGVIIALLAIRFVLILLGASLASPFVGFIYTISEPFAVPFFGIFGYALEYGVSKVELSTLVAIAIYALVAFGIVKLLTIRRGE